MAIKNEIEKFFTNVQKVIFFPRNPGKTDLWNAPVVRLLFSQEQMQEYSGKDFIPKVMEFLRPRKPILLINPVPESIHFSIAEEDGKNPILMPNATYDISFPDFLQKTSWHDKIFLLIGSPDSFVVARKEESKDRLFLELQGYSFVK